MQSLIKVMSEAISASGGTSLITIYIQSGADL